MDIVVYNTSDGPVRVDDEGRIVGGQEFAVADSVAESVKAGIEDGTLVKINKPKKMNDDINPQVRDVFDQLAESQKDDDGDDEPATKKSVKKTTREGSDQ